MARAAPAAARGQIKIVAWRNRRAWQKLVWKGGESGSRRIFAARIRFPVLRHGVSSSATTRGWEGLKSSGTCWRTASNKACGFQRQRENKR